ncbi:MAG: hypothetical protein ACLTMP_01805 [Eggerthella lenta]
MHFHALLGMWRCPARWMIAICRTQPNLGALGAARHWSLSREDPDGDAAASWC